MSDKVMVISADGHAAPPLADYRPYVEPAHREAFEAMLVDGAAQVTVEFLDSGILAPDVATRFKATMYDSGAILGQGDPDRRLAVLAAEGIVGEVLFPDGAPFGAGGVGSSRRRWAPDLELAGARAYNRWMADFIDGRPGLGAQSIAVLYDIDEAVKDVTWVKEHGFKAIFMPGMDDDRPLYWDPIYDPFWAACADAGLPLNFHGGTGQPPYRAMDDSGVPAPVRDRVAGLEFPWWAHRPLWFLIYSGVLERHPGLRLVFTEQHSDWMAGVVAQMDHSWHNSMMNDALKETVPRPPSEYVREQVWVGSSLLARGELISRNQIGAGKMMFGADFPHPEGTWGFTREYLRATVGATDMDEAEIRAFLGGTAAEVFGFDTDVLAPLAEEHGLTLEEVTTPLPIEEEAVLRRVDALRPTTALTALR